MRDGDIRDLLADHALGLLAPGDAERVDAALAASPALRAEAEALRGALYTLPAGLDPELPAPGAWQQLIARTRASDFRGGTLSGATDAGRPAATDAPGSGPRRPARRLSVALAAAVVLLAGSLGWGTLQHRRVALQAHEQAVVAYWMRIPGMQVVPMQAADGPVSGVHPGVVCVLPDGRAMVLQPHPAPEGGGYVLYGDTGTGKVELGHTRGTLIEFRAEGLRGVEVAIPGPRGGVVATASLR